MSFSVLREALHLLKQAGNTLPSIQHVKAASCIFSAKFFHTNFSCGHSVKTNVPNHSLKKPDQQAKIS